MEKFSNLPAPVKAGVAVGGVGGVLMTGMLMGSGKWLFLGILVLLLAICVGGYVLWRIWTRKKQAARMSGDLQQHSSASPRAIADPGARARLDDLRKKFDQGVSEYRSRGKDLYTLPWYVIVGEPGSGKTEAIRHSNVGFPPGMQDEFQGVGGTINMNWWFTNHAVLLDTAGRLMFEEVKPGEQSEWKEFLTLLKKNRPNCPINGLFLVIPSDSLIKDSADDIARKAGKIAQQLDVIQRVLDVRFPVYVIVTKCDKINGFREFFDGLTDPQLQHQMMGWSNPDALDTPFRPDLVDQHLDKVVNRLRRRRTGCLRDPVPENSNARRADEVDTLYALPHSLSLLAPRLRRYLETIFVAGEWSAKPLFLRGIYFTSSMREGAALDEELAKAIGVGVEELGEEKVWERERAYFLRDLFLEKVFREKGLVTRATNTSRMLRSRQLALYGGGAAALALIVLMAWFGMRTLRSGVKDQSDYWSAVAAAGWNNKTWKQSIVPMVGSSYANYLTNEVTVAGKKVPLGEFHVRLHELASQPLKRNLLFPGLAGKYQRESKRAQRIVFETGVVQPLLEATRQKIGRDLSGDDESLKRLPDALATLIELEGQISARAKGDPAPLIASDAERFLGRLMSFVTARETAPEPKLVTAMTATYAAGDDEGVWPSPHLSGTIGGTNRLAANRGISDGIAALEKFASRTLSDRLKEWSEATALRDELRAYQRIEGALATAAEKNEATAFRTNFFALSQVKTNIDRQLQKLADSALFQSGRSLSNAYQQFRLIAANNSEGPLAKARQATRPASGRQTNAFFVEIDRRIAAIQDRIAADVQGVVKTDELETLRQLDDNLLGRDAYAERWKNYYQPVLQSLTGNSFADVGFGTEGQRLNARLAENKAQRERAGQYNGPNAAQVKNILSFGWNQADTAQINGFIAAYQEQALRKLKNLGFPFVNAPAQPVSGDKLKQLAEDLGFIAKDMQSPILQPHVKGNPSWQQLSARVSACYQVSRALVSDDGEPLKCTISLVKIDDSKPRDAWRLAWRRMALLADGNELPLADTNLPEDKPLGEVRVNQSLAFKFLKTQDDANKLTVPPTPNWGPVQFLFARHAGQSAKRDGKTWIVEIPSQHEAVQGSIALKIEFKEPLPELKEWPAPF